MLLSFQIYTAVAQKRERPKKNRRRRVAFQCEQSGTPDLWSQSTKKTTSKKVLLMSSLGLAEAGTLFRRFCCCFFVPERSVCRSMYMYVCACFRPIYSGVCTPFSVLYTFRRKVYYTVHFFECMLSVQPDVSAGVIEQGSYSRGTHWSGPSLLFIALCPTFLPRCGHSFLS